MVLLAGGALWGMGRKGGPPLEATGKEWAPLEAVEDGEAPSEQRKDELKGEVG